MSLTMDCPERACWQALIADTLPPDEQERCARHLESCPACQERLDQAEDCRDSLVKLARQFGDPTIAPADSSLIQVLKHLHEDRSLVPAASAEAPDLYFLRPASRPDLLGTLGAYEVQEVIGQGGMGVVLKAFEPALHRLVAIKVLAPAVAGSATARRRFTREAQAAAAVCHDHIVAVHGVHEADGLPYLVMQYVAGESLQDRLDRTGPLELMDVVRIGHQAAAGLAAAHVQGLIHRDIKPANLLLENGLARVKITDFGLARMIDDVGLTQNGVVAGTPEYMAPEQARGEPVDHRADLFSLGSVLYAMCSGRPPFRGATTVAVLRQVSDQVPTLLRALNPDVPAWLEALINRLLAKDPAARFQSAAQVATLLEGYLAHLRQPATVAAPELPSGPADLPTSRPGDGTTRRNRQPRLLLIVLLLMALGLGMAWRFLGAGNAAPEPDPQPKVFRQDFRGCTIDPDFFLYTGPNARQQVIEEAEGLHISLPAENTRPQPTGIVAWFPVKGDCEITTSYELLQAEKPMKGSGVGVGLYVKTDTPTMEAAMVSRLHGRNGHFYACERMTTQAGGKRQYLKETFPTEARSGKLRLVRRGPVLTYQVADQGGAFRELYQAELGKEDLVHIRVAADTGNSDSPVEVRIHDFEIRAQEVPAQAPPGGPPLEMGPGGSRAWLATVELLGLVITLGVVTCLGMWFFGRQARRAEQKAPDAVAPPKPAAPVVAVSFACAACGKNLKARAELAGKKVKCPQCGQAVRVSV